MPYLIKKVGNKFQVLNKDTGKSHGMHDSEEKAQRQINLLQAIEHGWKPGKKK